MQTRIVLSILFLTVFGAALFFNIDTSSIPQVTSTKGTTDSEIIESSKLNNSNEMELSEKLEETSPASVKKVMNDEPQIALEQKMDRLVELENTIDANNDVLSSLIEKYDQNLGDETVKQELSTALLENREYRLSMLEKFKLDHEVKQLNQQN